MSSGRKRKVNVLVNGKAYLVEIEDLAVFPTTVIVNDQAYLVSIGEVEETNEDEPVLTQAVALPVTHSASPTTKLGGPLGQVTAPMPGNIVEVYVQAGDQVDAGQKLCSLEAMKMKNAIHSPREGVIASVDVSVGQTVAYDAVLFTFE